MLAFKVLLWYSIYFIIALISFVLYGFKIFKNEVKEKVEANIITKLNLKYIGINKQDFNLKHGKLYYVEVRSGLNGVTVTFDDIVLYYSCTDDFWNNWKIKDLNILNKVI